MFSMRKQYEASFKSLSTLPQPEMNTLIGSIRAQRNCSPVERLVRLFYLPNKYLNRLMA